MGIFLQLNNVDRFPGLVVRVRGGGDEIEINYDAKHASTYVSNNGQTVADTTAVKPPVRSHQDGEQT